MTKVEELNELYNIYADAIDAACMAIGMGANVEHNRRMNGINSDKIAKLREEAAQLGIKLERRKWWQ